MSLTLTIVGYLDSKEDLLKCIIVRWSTRRIEGFMILAQPVRSVALFDIDSALHFKVISHEIYLSNLLFT